MSVFVRAMVGIAFWHFAILVPDRFTGGIVGAFLAALGGALVTGYLLPSPGVPTSNPPEFAEGLCRSGRRRRPRALVSARRPALGADALFSGDSPQ